MRVEQRILGESLATDESHQHGHVRLFGRGMFLTSIVFTHVHARVHTAQTHDQRTPPKTQARVVVPFIHGGHNACVQTISLELSQGTWVTGYWFQMSTH